MKKRIRLVMTTVALAAAWMPAPRANAQQVLWGSPVGVPSETSAGASMNVSFTFQLGAFFENGVSGWTPSAANTAEWADHWLSADSAAYDATYRTFTNNCLVEGTFAGGQGYIWGFNSTAGDGEWILMTDPSWVFPSSASALSFPLSWRTSAATATIVGSIDNAPGAAFHLKTSAVGENSPPFLPSEQWLGMHFTPEQLAEPLIGGWMADPDRDGMNNLLEMALGAPPHIAGGRERLPQMEYIDLGGSYYLTLRVQRAPNVATVLGAEVSSDMVQWESGAGKVTVVSDDPDELLIRDNIAVGESGARYIRLRIGLEE